MARKKKPELFNLLVTKGSLKQEVYRNTAESFGLVKKVIKELMDAYNKEYADSEDKVPFDLINEGEFEIHVRFAGDVLIFMMHTNVFEFSRDHEVMKTSYIKEDKSRSYCGMINIYNFLADSFKYNRLNDIGYLIGRMFINKDKYYFVEGKRELGMLYPNFGKEQFSKEAAKDLVASAIEYTINFDLLTPPYDSYSQVNLAQVKSIMDSHILKTGKRLGFKFQADIE